MREMTMPTLSDTSRRVEASSGETVLPPENSTLITEVQDFLAAHSRSAALEADGQRVELPDEVFTVLESVVQTMVQGKAVTVAPVEMRLTTSQAADILGISRPTLIRLLDDGALPFEQPRRHRLLRLGDVLAYKERRHVETRMVLAEMTRQAVEDGLYDDTYETYDDALRKARKGEI